MDPSRTRRIARHVLEDLQRAGVTDWPRGDRRSTRAEESTSVTAANAGEPSARQQALQFARQNESNPQAASPTSQTMSPETPPHKLSRSERGQQLQLLSQRVAACRLCAELAETRTQTVFGVGDPEAQLMFIGEAPGADEDRVGEPFVGRAGQLLNRIIAACGMQRDAVYICNILRCRPPNNRNPSDEEALNCREYLDGQIRIVDPEYIVCLGAVAARNLLDTTAPIGRLRKKFFDYGRAKVICTYHPSYLLRNPAAKRDVWEDMKLLLRDMGIDVDKL